MVGAGCKRFKETVSCEVWYVGLWSQEVMKGWSESNCRKQTKAGRGSRVAEEFLAKKHTYQASLATRMP